MTPSLPPTSTSPLARFDALFSEHQRTVLAYAMRRTDQLADAEDVAAAHSAAWNEGTT